MWPPETGQAQDKTVLVIMRPAPQVHQFMRLCDLAVDGVAIGHQHASLSHTGIQDDYQPSGRPFCGVGHQGTNAQSHARQMGNSIHGTPPCLFFGVVAKPAYN